MNWDRFEGKWHEFKGRVREKWGELTDDDVDRIEGSSEQLAGLIQQAYGREKEEAEKEAKSFIWDLQKEAWSNQLAGSWTMAKGKVKEKWGKLTENEVTEIDGSADRLLGAIQKEYGIEQGEAAAEMRDFFIEAKLLFD